ncbi:sensor histidine kinase [Szabonella alba]|uniref:histidine kinase n=1 Tax=Szabonella alba TaxID=2804194 RepID=A0A8K0VDQ0_9RHOB|nr:HAMP domain-containing sensor histidine kinase [Szabonella alba]MBL4917412.1 HAMP domain-containing histidine kinase [Szabonella alba]
MLKQAYALAALTVASFVALLVYAFLNLVGIQRELQQELVDANLWSTAQAERETQQLMIALAGGFADPANNDVSLRFEILYSRVALLAEGPQLAYFRSAGFEPVVTEAQRLLAELDDMLATPLTDDDSRSRFLQRTAELADELRTLSNATNLQERTERLERRDGQSDAMRLLLVAVVGIFVTGALMAGLLLSNIRRLVQARTELQRHQATLEEKIEQRTHALKEALEVERRAKDVYRSFIVTVSHQFRTPVSIIHMIAQRQIRNGGAGMTDDLRRRFVRIFEAAERLEKLMGAFLDSARIDGRAGEASRRDLDLGRLVEDALDQIRAAHPDRVILAELDPGPLKVEGDPVLLEQVLLNLLTNAVKYSSAPAPIHVSTRSQGRILRFCVRDQGVGVPSDAQLAIFDRFYRAPNVHRLPGVGVGLSLARDIVVQHGGVISLTSQEGVGSTFTVALPGAGGRIYDEGEPAGDNSLCRG